MYDDDIYSNFLNSLNSTTTTEQETDTSSTYNPSYNQTESYNPYGQTSNYSGYQDDYSVTPNYEEQQSYNTIRQTSEPEIQTQRQFSQMQTPMIKREAPAVVLTKTRQRIHLQARMKIVLAMFVTIICSLLFVSVFNFINVSKINVSIAEKEITIEELQASISDLKTTYNLVSDDGTVRYEASKDGFVDRSAENTTVLSVGEVYTEPTIEDLPSNWFNDVCDFFSNLFAA